MKFKVKVLMLLVSMLFSALGASAQIEEGVYIFMMSENGFFNIDDTYNAYDRENATQFRIIPVSEGNYQILVENTQKYLSIDAFMYDPQESDSEVVWKIMDDNNGGYSISIPGFDSDGYDYLTFTNGYATMGDIPYSWKLVLVGGGAPTTTYIYKVILNDAPDNGTITVGSASYKNGDTFSSTQLETSDIKNYTESGYRVEDPVISDNTTDSEVDYDITINYHKQYTYQVYLNGAPSGTKILFDGEEKAYMEKLTIEYELTNDNVNDHVDAKLAGYDTQVSIYINNGNKFINVEYTRVYTYTVKFTEDSPADAYVTVKGVSGQFGNDATFTRDTKISNFNTEIIPRPYSGRTSQVIGTKIDEYNYIATVIYYQASLTSGEYYRFATSEYMLKAAPDQSYEDEELSNLVVSVDDKSDMNNIWQAVQAGEGNLMYLRHANSEQYLSKKQNDGTYTLVATTEQAGKFSKEGDSMREGDNYLTITDGNLTTSNEPSAIWSRTAEVDVVTLTLNDYGYATTCMPFNFTVSKGAEIYGTTDVHDYSDYTTLKVYQVEGVAQAGQGYIIKGEPRAEGEPQKTVTLTPTTSEADDEAESSMLGTLIRQTGVYTSLGYKYYGFKGDEFVLAASDNIPANKAVYIPASPSPVMRMSLGFDEGLTTDILGLTPSASTQQPIYDLQGRSCKSHSLQGLYLQGGRKMIRR